MTQTSHLIRSACLTGFTDLAQSAGLDPFAMMQKAGLPRRCLDDNETLVGMEAVCRLLGDCAQAAEMEAFGLRLASRRRIWELGPVSLVIKQESTALSAVKTLLSYNRVIQALLAADHPLVASLPRLWPLPGHTPDPVRAAAEWVEERGLARISWSESKDAALDHYEVRGCPGEKYDRGEEELLGKVSAGGERVLETARLLETPGAAGCFRVYVVLKTGNERASNPVAVERPG